MKNIAIIPARGGSKRLPGKNIKNLNGLPLIAHSILYAKKNSDIIDEIYVTTDDLDIKKIAIKYGAKVIDRPQNLSQDLEPTVTALAHVLLSIDYEVDTVILLQPTNPLRPEKLLSEAYELFEKEKYTSLFTVTRNYQKFGKILKNQFLPFNYEVGQRSQDLEPIFFENGLLYITKSELILNNSIISKSAFPYIVEHSFAEIDIDTIEDFEYAEYIINKTNAN
jgi:CMP-N-acetylneuraminic acid synthetase